jgi:F-type H+-transporting ATPase subunit a
LKKMNVLEHLRPAKILGLNLFGLDVTLSNTVLTGFLAVFLILTFFFVISKRAKLIPSLPQTVAEFIIQFINDEMLAPLGEEGGKWLPFIASIFCFILTCNLLGLIPGLMPPTSNINVTASLAIIVFLTVQTAGIVKKGPLGYFASLVPPGVPVFLAPFLFPIELIGQLARPFSLSVRLFANMFAGHAIILTLISMIFVFNSDLVIPFPVIGNVAILAFELFVSFIQAFIFSFLSATYIVGALQSEH